MKLEINTAIVHMAEGIFADTSRLSVKDVSDLWIDTGDVAKVNK